METCLTYYPGEYCLGELNDKVQHRYLAVIFFSHGKDRYMYTEPLCGRALAARDDVSLVFC